MTIKRTTEFAPADRYLYDFKMLTYERGWAQVDTRGDASYYGNWCNPTKRALFSYCEGDTTLIQCDTDEEFVAETRRCADWHRENGSWLGIDPGFGEPMKARFAELGLADLLH